MTIDSAVRVTNAKNNIILALSRSGAAAALIHPNGRVYHYGSRVEIQARHQQGNNKLVTYTRLTYFFSPLKDRHLIAISLEAVAQVFTPCSILGV